MEDKHHFQVEKRNRNVDLHEAIDSLVKKVEKIDASDVAQGQKTQAHRRAAESFIRFLNGARANAKRKRKQLAISTVKSYLSECRKVVTRKGWFHHSFDDQINKLHAKFPASSYLIDSIEGKSLVETRVAIQALKEKLEEGFELMRVISQFDECPQAGHIAAYIHQFGLWTSELQQLKLAKKGDKDAVFQSLISTLDESKALYDALVALKVDHEVMRWLTLSTLEKRTSYNQASAALKMKKERSINVDMTRLMPFIELMLKGGPGETWRSLATGVALATGRRSIEILHSCSLEAVGDYELKFNGQAKKVRGADSAAPYTILSLMPAEMVVEAFQRLRAQQEVVELNDRVADNKTRYTTNQLIANRTSGPLNEFFRSLMDTAKISTGFEERPWRFHDTRTISIKTAIIRFAEHPLIAGKDEDAKIHQLAGHDLMETQMHYKQMNPVNIFKEWQSIELSEIDRVEALKAFDEHQYIVSSRAMSGLHEWMKGYLKTHPDDVPKISFVRNKKKGGRGGDTKVIGAYYQLVGHVIESMPGIEDMIESGAKKEDDNAVEKTAVKHEAEEKPKFVPHHIGDGRWNVQITFKGEVRTMPVFADNAMEAGKAAWHDYLFVTQESPDITAHKQGGWWTMRAERDGRVFAEVQSKGKKAEVERELLAELRRYGIE